MKTLTEMKDELDKLITHLDWIKSTREYNWGRNGKFPDLPYAKLEHDEMMERYRKTTKKIKKLRKRIEMIEIIISEVTTIKIIR